MVRIGIPVGMKFSDLRLSRSAGGLVRYEQSIIERIVAANGLSTDSATEDLVTSLIVAWYSAHRLSGGEPDPVAEDLIAEVRLEDAAGQIVSHQPGRA